MEEAEYAYDMGIIKLRQPIRVLFTSKFDDDAAWQRTATLSERVRRRADGATALRTIGAGHGPLCAG